MHVPPIRTKTEIFSPVDVYLLVSFFEDLDGTEVGVGVAVVVAVSVGVVRPVMAPSAVTFASSEDGFVGWVSEVVVSSNPSTAITVADLEDSEGSVVSVVSVVAVVAEVSVVSVDSVGSGTVVVITS